MNTHAYRHRTQRRHSRGVTLVELMVVVVVVGILTGIAYPAYRQQVIRANRTEAKTTLMEIAGNLEKCYTRWHAYNSPNCTVQTTQSLAQYDIAPEVATGTTTYRLAATPKGGQTADTKCGTLSIDQIGTRRPDKGTDGRPCW